MRKLLLSTAAMFLLVVPALAQPHGNRGEDHSDRGGQEHSDRGGKAAPQVQDRAQPQLRAQAQPGGRGEERRGEDRGRGERGAAPAPQATIQSPAPSNRGNWQGRDNRGNANNNRGADRRDWNNGRDRADFNRDGRTDFRFNDRRRAGNGGPRHDFSGFRDYHRNFQVSRRFNVPYYRRPAGWYSHRWTFGEFLPAAFWARDYWLADFQAYDLPPPPYGAVWVRVNSDALLIDEESGEVITVAYNVFY